MKKQLYEQPTTKTLVVRFETGILNGSPYGALNQPGRGWGGESGDDIISIDEAF